MGVSKTISPLPTVVRKWLTPYSLSSAIVRNCQIPLSSTKLFSTSKTKWKTRKVQKTKCRKDSRKFQYQIFVVTFQPHDRFRCGSRGNIFPQNPDFFQFSTKNHEFWAQCHPPNHWSGSDTGYVSTIMSTELGLGRSRNIVTVCTNKVELWWY